jgi:hypothetical protein
MASVVETVRDMIFNYPMLHENRTQALHRLFVMYGTGYEWVDGELVNKYPEPEQTDAEVGYTVDGSIKEVLDKGAERSEEGRAFRDSYLAEMAVKNEAILAVRRDADRLALTAGPLQNHIYEPCPEYAPLFNAPEDITADWAAARAEIAAVALPLWQAKDHLGVYSEEDREKAARREALSVKDTRLLSRLAAGHNRQDSTR